MARCEDEAELAEMFDAGVAALQRGDIKSVRELLGGVARRRAGYQRNGMDTTAILAEMEQQKEHSAWLQHAMNLLLRFKRQVTIGAGVTLLLIISISIVALPPLLSGYRTINPKTGGWVSTSDETRFVIPAGVAQSGVSIRLTTQSRDAFLRSSLAKDLPISLDVISPLYLPNLQGRIPNITILSLSIPGGIDLFSLDVYGYTGNKWVKLPFQLFYDEQRLDAYMTTFIPQGVVLCETTPIAPIVSADVTSKTSLPTQLVPVISEVNPIGYTLADGGGIYGSIPQTEVTGISSPYEVIPTVSNFDGEKWRGDLVDEVIADYYLRQERIQLLVDLAIEKLYPGLTIDYQNINPDNQKEFTAFINVLARSLHAKEKKLSVTMAVPVQKSPGKWDTGAFDWIAIGQAVDIVKIPALDHTQFSGNPSPFEDYLQWAVGQVDRYKLQLAFSVMGRDEVGTLFSSVSFGDALKLLGSVTISGKPLPGEKLTFDLPKLREGRRIINDPPTGMYTFTYVDDKAKVHSVWMENAGSFARKIAYARQYNLRGVALRDVKNDAVEGRVWETLNSYRRLDVFSYKDNPVILWRVNGQTVGKVPIGDPGFVWTAPTQLGNYRVEAVLSFDNGQTIAGIIASTSLEVTRR
jgi:spore germination protein